MNPSRIPPPSRPRGLLPHSVVMKCRGRRCRLHRLASLVPTPDPRARAHACMHAYMAPGGTRAPIGGKPVRGTFPQDSSRWTGGGREGRGSRLSIVVVVCGGPRWPGRRLTWRLGGRTHGRRDREVRGQVLGVFQGSLGAAQHTVRHSTAQQCPVGRGGCFRALSGRR
jgi:hypothetical protein